MIRVSTRIYRLLWVTSAVLGGICSIGAIPLFLGGDGVTVISGESWLVAGVVLGAFILIYALWRLFWPLKAPPRT